MTLRPESAPVVEASHLPTRKGSRHGSRVDTHDRQHRCTGAGTLARFYQQLLGWEITVEKPDWVLMRDPHGGVGLAFQTEPFSARPVWPAGPYSTST